MSTADWPDAWGAQHEAVCAFSRVTTRLTRDVGDVVVELWQWLGDDEQERCLGAVPIDIDHKMLAVLIKAITASYSRGFADGQTALADAIQAPIAKVLQGNQRSAPVKTRKET